MPDLVLTPVPADLAALAISRATAVVALDHETEQAAQFLVDAGWAPTVGEAVCLAVQRLAQAQRLVNPS